MERGETGKKRAKSSSEAAVRVSISFPHDVHQTLEGVAKEKKVSFAWVVRDAAEKYIADKWPLFRGPGKI
jgi:metal-responsive CopG/Arc/MetJ family transcriptional regulator